jgi:DNA-binding response OmpR family regulator
MCTILIHEPEAIISLDLTKSLYRYNIVTSRATTSLFKLLRKHSFDMMIIDVSRIRGWRPLIKLLLRFNKPIIILTPDSRCFDLHEIGNIRIIDIPFNYQEIIASVESFISDQRLKN